MLTHRKYKLKTDSEEEIRHEQMDTERRLR